MQLKTLPLFYHPSTIVMVDDESAFLKSTVTALSRRAADCRGFYRPEVALQFLNSSSEEHPLFSHENMDARTEYLDSPENLARFLETDARFKFVSTVIVDYTMPTMSGLEFCRALKSPFIRKIMLTGNASLDVAIKAFNEGLIDKFFKKSDENIGTSINTAVIAAEYEYFAKRSERWLESLPQKEILPSWFHQPNVIQFLISQIQQEQSVEFYTLNEAGDILLINAQGEKSLLLFRDEEAMAEQFIQAEYAYQTEPAPEALPLLDQLKNNKLILEPLTEEEMYSSLDELQPFLHPAVSVSIDEESYFYTIIPESKTHITDYLGRKLAIKPLSAFTGQFKIE